MSDDKLRRNVQTLGCSRTESQRLMELIARETAALLAWQRTEHQSGAPPICDAIAEDWFESIDAMGAAFGSPAGQAVQADSANFLDMSKFQMMVVEEEAIKEVRHPSLADSQHGRGS